MEDFREKSFSLINFLEIFSFQIKTKDINRRISYILQEALLLISFYLNANYVPMEPGVSFSGKRPCMSILFHSSGNVWLEGTRLLNDSGKLYTTIFEEKPSNCGEIIIAPTPTQDGHTIKKDNGMLIFRFMGKADDREINDQASVTLRTQFNKHPIVDGETFNVLVATVTYKIVYLPNLGEWHIGILDVETFGTIPLESGEEKVTHVFSWIKSEDGGMSITKVIMKFTSHNIVPE